MRTRVLGAVRVPFDVERLRETTAGLAEGVLAVDRDCRLVYVNDAAKEMLGWPPEGEPGVEAMLRPLHLPETSGAGCPMLDVVSSGLPYLAEREYLVRTDGSTFPVVVFITPLYERGRVSGGVLVFCDLLERDQAARALQDSESKYRRLVELAQEGILALDIHGSVTFANPRMAEMLGCSPEEMIGRPVRDFVQEWDRDLAATLLGAELPAPPARRELDLVGRDRQPLHVTVSSAPVVDDRGRSVGVIAAITDITDRKRMEDAMRESEAAQRAIFNSVNDAVFIHDPVTGRIVDANEGMTEMYGYSREETLHLTVGDLSAPSREYGLSVAVELVRRAAAGEPQSFEWQARDKQARVFWVEVNLKRVELGGEERVVAVVRDITRRKETEEVLRQKDLAIRQAYVDVIGAVTGGKLVLMSSEEIRETLGEPLSEEGCVNEYSGLSEARHAVERTAEEAFPGVDLGEGIVAVGEALTNAVKHAGGGTYRVFVKRGKLQVLISDHGPGVDFSVLPKATLMAGFSTKVSLGMGFTIMLEIADRLLLSTMPGETLVVLELDVDHRG